MLVTAVLDEVPVPLVMVNSINEILLCNTAARAIFNVTASVIGSPISNYLPGYDPCDALVKGSTRQVEGRTRTGQALHLLLEVKELGLYNHKPLYLLNICSIPGLSNDNMDSLVAPNVDVISGNHLDEQQSDMVRQLSHDLRTPLTSILGALTLLTTLDEDNHSRDTDRLIYIALENSVRMKSLIDSMVL